jgi:hypothetical protein
LGRSRRKTALACCRDQRWEETGRFFNRGVRAEGAEKVQVEALTLAAITGSSSMIRIRDVTTDDNSQLRILPRARNACLFGGIVSLDLINALATNRTKANMNPAKTGA